MNTAKPIVSAAPIVNSDDSSGHPLSNPNIDGTNDIARFLAHVVPWPAAAGDGFINIHWTQGRAADGKVFWRGKPTTRVSEAVELVGGLLRHDNVRDIYFCLSRQRASKLDQRGNIAAERSKKNAIALQSIWLDIDVKDPPNGYASAGEASAALKAFYEAVGLPPPTAVVFSGGGLHVYWSSTKPLTPDEWRPLAERLKNATLKHGLRCDTACTTDRARILRLPDTFNCKNDLKRPVKLLWLGASYDF